MASPDFCIVMITPVLINRIGVSLRSLLIHTGAACVARPSGLGFALHKSLTCV